MEGGNRQGIFRSVCTCATVHATGVSPLSTYLSDLILTFLLWSVKLAYLHQSKKMGEGG